LPFDRTFPDSYPEYLTKNDLATGYSNWVKKFNIVSIFSYSLNARVAHRVYQNVWVDTALQSGRWVEDDQSWRLNIVREGKALEVTATHVVMAVGAGCQIPVMPEYPNKVSSSKNR
jgi:cation diffusion facilitator CzcD-associated flavoprotein CzcO